MVVWLRHEELRVFVEATTSVRIRRGMCKLLRNFLLLQRKLDPRSEVVSI